MVASAPVLLQMKLAIPPVRVDRVPRPRLTQQFDASLNFPLTLICAPAGFGKTTLITDWYEQQADKSDFPLAWLSLDEDDNDPSRFLTYLISALANVSGNSSGDLLLLLHSPQPSPPKVILTALISRLERISNRFALVLDDYHLLTAPPLREILVFLLDHLPAQMRLVITSRDDPPMSLSRFRAGGQLAEIRADDLRFTPEESAQFLWQMHGIRLSVEQVKDLDTRTEGWIAGLQLAALAMKGHGDISGFISAFTGSHRFILDYLTDEVLSRQSELLQRFLLQTSVLNRLNGELCAAVTGRLDSQALLEQAEHGNLFLTSLDDERSWYRYHHLFADMLQRRLQQSHPDMVSQLHQRASLWYEQAGWVADAVEHALLARDGERFAALVERFGPAVGMRGEAATLFRWLAAVPEEALRTRPKLGLTYAFMLTITDEYAAADQQLQAVEQALAKEEHFPDAAQRSALLGQAAAIRATVLLLDGSSAEMTLAAGGKALALLAETEVHWRAWTTMIMGVAHYAINGNVTEGERYLKEAIRLGEKIDDVFTLMFALSHLSRLYAVGGRLSQADAVAETLLGLATKWGWTGHARVARSSLRYERNDLHGAREDATEAHRTIQEHLLNRISLDACVIMARLSQVQHQESKAWEFIRQAAALVQAHRMKRTFLAVDAWQARFSLMQGDFAAAARWALTIEPTAQDSPRPDLEFEHLTLARIYIAQGRLEEAQRLLMHLEAAAEEADRFGRVISARVLRVLAFCAQGETEQGLELLTHAMTLAEPEGYIRSFVDEGAPMQSLLRKLQARAIAPAYTARLLAAFVPPDTQPINLHVQPASDGEPERLSKREQEVLRLMMEGASNREVAQELVVSLGTIKKHLNNIFVKLGAHSRTQAIAIARQQNLL